MSFNVAMLEAMQTEGLDLGACIRVLKAGEKKTDPTAAARQARCRANKVSRRDVTRDPPIDNTLTPSEPEEAKASLVSARRKTADWPCPEGVEEQHWADFLANRKRKRLPNTQTALDGQMSALATLADNEWPPGRLVQHAAAKGWGSINDPRRNPFDDRQHQQPSVGKTSQALQRLGGVRDTAPM